MSEQEMLEQLYSLIDDRNSFINGETNCEEFKNDKLALKTIIDSYNHNKVCLAGYRDSVLRQCGKSQTQLSITEDIMAQNEKLKQENQKYKETIDKAMKHCNQEISASSIQYERSHNQQDLVYKVAHERVLDILKEVK